MSESSLTWTLGVHLLYSIQDRVSIFLSQIVLSHKDVAIPFHYVFRQERDLPSPAQEINGKMGYAQTGCVALKGGHDLKSPVEGSPEVCGSSCRICLKQIIGPDPNCQEFLHQCPDNPGVIINPFKEHGLAAQGDTCVGQSIACQGGLRGNFIRMVKVGIDIDRLKTP